MTDANGTTRPAEVQESSTGDLVKQLTGQVSRLVRDELKLAQVEMTSAAASTQKLTGRWPE